MTVNDLLSTDPYALGREEKEKVLFSILLELTRRHYAACGEYRALLDHLGVDIDSLRRCEDIPLLPVRLFKDYELLSVPREDIKKIMTSSGTSGQKVSKVFLDTRNVREQSAVLTQLISSFIGKARMPLIILDTSIVKKDRSMFSARGAGVIGFSIYGRDILYALDENMRLQTEQIEAYVEKHRGEPILLFGYTYMIWEYVVREMEKRGIRFDMDRAELFHIGGWKKLRDQAVDTQTFNARLKDRLGSVNIHNYYGMAEQLGSVYIECEHGHMHCSNYSDVIIRDPKTFSVCPHGEAGMIQLVSALPTSYPGHSILTEDEGVVLGEDDCPCGRKGKYFRILGRIKNAEIRGCSDTYERK